MKISKRQGVTAVELLVVIAIMGILASLIMGAVMLVRGADQGATTQIEIREMVTGLENFKTRFGIYPPSQVTLSPNPSQADPILLQMWPTLDHASAFGAQGLGLSGPVTLKGDQCLVLFLGGRPDGTGCQGFSTSKRNPFLAGGDREGPWFKFKRERLFQRDPSAPFFSYGDGFFKMALGGTPQYTSYAYFAPTRAAGYDGSLAHCDSVRDAKGTSPLPFKDASNAYLNRQSFQIMSSGKNLLWGSERKWAFGGTIADPDSADNITNFAGGTLAGG